MQFFFVLLAATLSSGHLIIKVQKTFLFSSAWEKTFLPKARLKQILSSTYSEIYFLLFLMYNDECLQIVTLLWYSIEKKSIILVQQRSYILRDFFMRVAKTAAVLAVLCTHKVPFLFTFNLQSSEVRGLCLMKWVSTWP